MKYYRKTAHSKYDLKVHVVFVTKYRKKILKGEVRLYSKRTNKTDMHRDRGGDRKWKGSNRSCTFVSIIQTGNVSKQHDAKDKGKELV